MEGVTCLRLPTHPSAPLTPTHPSAPLTPTHPFIHAIPDIRVAVNNFAQNPAVLAS